VLPVTAKSLKRDLLRGTEIDLTFEVSESRTLTVHAYINPSGPEFSVDSSLQFRQVDAKALAEEIGMLEEKIEQEKAEALEHENYEVVDVLTKLSGPVQELQGEAVLLSMMWRTTNTSSKRKRRLQRNYINKAHREARAEYVEVRDG
jgi:molecular chaperone DnaK